jgi:hypothetical protein
MDKVIPAQPGSREQIVQAMMQARDPQLRMAGLQSLLPPAQKPQEQFTLSPGQMRFDPSGKPLAMLPKDKTDDSLKERNMTFDNSAKMRQEFINQSKDFKQVRDSYERIQNSAENPSAAGDLALIFNYMKMLDPGSTVREGEFATAQNSAGIPERVAAMYNRAIKGERLTGETRSDFLNRAGSMYQAQLGGQEQLENTYRGLSERSGFNPTNVIIDYRVKRKEKPKPQGGLSAQEQSELDQLRKELNGGR